MSENARQRIGAPDHELADSGGFSKERLKRIISGNPVRKRVLRLALPAIGEQILLMMVGLVDTYMMGHISPAALAAVGLANQALMVVLVFVLAVATGTTALVARQVGAEEPEEANISMQQSLLLGLVIGLLVTIPLVTMSRQAISLFGADPDVMEMGQQYLRVVGMGFVFQSVLILGNAALRGAGDTRTPPYVMGLVNGLNIVLSYLLINGSGPFPAWGVVGTAAGASVARLVGGSVIVALLARGRGVLHLQRKGWRPNPKIIKRLFNVGLPAGAEQLLMRLGQASFAGMVAALGTSAFAAHQVALRSQSLSFMPGFGFSIAATTMVGQALGSDDPDEARASVRETLTMAATFMVLGGLILFIFASQVMDVFVGDAAIIDLGARCARIFGLGQIAVAMMMVYSGALRGAGDTRFTLVATASAVWLVRIPLVLLMTRTLNLGLQGVWWAMLTDMSLRAVVYWRRFRSGAWAEIEV